MICAHCNAETVASGYCEHCGAPTATSADTPASTPDVAVTQEPEGCHSPAANPFDPPTASFTLLWQRKEYRCGEQENFRFRLTNHEEKDLRRISLATETQGSRQPCERSFLRVGESWEQAFPFVPDKPGKGWCVDVIVTVVDHRGNARVYRGQQEFVVRNHAAVGSGGAREVHIHQHYQADNRGQIIGGGDVRIQGLEGLSPAVKPEPAEAPPIWEPVTLFFDYDASRSLVERNADRQEKRVVLTAGVREKLPIERGRLSYCAGGSGREFLLFSQPKVVLGRGGAADIRLEVFTRGEGGAATRDKDLTMRIGRLHAEVSFQQGSFLVADLDSKNGTSLEGQAQPLRKGVPQALANGAVVRLGRVLKLEFSVFSDLDPGNNLTITGRQPQCAAAGGRAGTGLGYDQAGKIDAARLRRHDALADQEEYVFVVKQALIGSSRSSCIMVAGEGVEPIHARIIFDRSCYFLEDLSGGATAVGGKRLQANSLHPLVEGDILRLGKTELLFRLLGWGASEGPSTVAP